MRAAIGSALMTLALVACGAGVAPTPEVSIVYAPTQTPIEPTSTLTSVPTRTAIAPSPTPSQTPLPSATPAPSPEPLPTFAPLTQTLSLQQRQQVFDAAWSFVNDNYVYADFLGVDWKAARQKFGQRVRATTSTAEFYALMREMFGLLRDNHSSFRDPRETQLATSVRYGLSGAEQISLAASTLWMGDGVLVLHVFPGFAAERDGLRAGDLIVRMDGHSPTNAERWNMMPGAAGPLRLSVRAPDGSAREIFTRREAIASDKIPPAVTATRLPNSNVGLVTIYSFRQRDLARHVRDALNALTAAAPLDALVLDLRGNGGGLIDSMRETMALFVNGGDAGRMDGRYNPYDIEIPSGQTLPKLKGVPLAILVGPHTNSAGEMFSASLRALGRAVVVGTTTNGNTENIVYPALPFGSSLAISVRLFHLPDGSAIEGKGVPLDKRVDEAWWRFAPADDPQIKAALELLKKR